jgi:hypothetical protein
MAAKAWGSLLSAPDFAAVTSVGFRPVGHVLGDPTAITKKSD